ncbi:MAG: type II toxin-antitoxin system VapB family antitoxin [Novosphingobium sp.]
MPFHVRDAETDTLVRQLAARQHIGLTDAIKTAVQNELKRLDETVPLEERIVVLSREIMARAVPTEQTDKEFFDELSGDY